MEHYRELLNKEIGEFISTRHYQSFHELTNAVLDTEQEIKKDAPPSSPKKRYDRNISSVKRLRSESESCQRMEYPICRNCRRRHLGECRLGKDGCYRSRPEVEQDRQPREGKRKELRTLKSRGRSYQIIANAVRKELGKGS
ncbi:hypothetical protein Tco_1324436, partial [Tanacetum coccineum]